MATTHSPRRARLAARLRELRAAHYRFGTQLATDAGWPQTKVSKIEQGRQLPSEGDLAIWLQLTDPDARDELGTLLADARVEHITWRANAGDGQNLAFYQEQLRRTDATARFIGEYQPAMLPGFVQTADYAREALAVPVGPVGIDAPRPDEIEQIVAGRMSRQDALYRPSCTVVMVIGEAALWARPGTAETMRGQLAKLLSLASLPGVRLGVVPVDTMPAMPLSSFRIVDDDVVIEHLAGELLVTDPEHRDGFRSVLNALLNAADTGDAAERRIRAALAQLPTEVPET